jgi:hypothetical protein
MYAAPNDRNLCHYREFVFRSETKSRRESELWDGQQLRRYRKRSQQIEHIGAVANIVSGVASGNSDSNRYSRRRQ